MGLVSKNHEKLVQFLSNMGFMVETEVEAGEYSIDCYVFDYHIGFEADTRKTHMRGRDKKRDRKIFNNYKLPILRIDETEYADKEQLEEKILGFVDQWYDTVEDRRKRFLPFSRGVI